MGFIRPDMFVRGTAPDNATDVETASLVTEIVVPPGQVWRVQNINAKVVGGTSHYITSITCTRRGVLGTLLLPVSATSLAENYIPGFELDLDEGDKITANSSATAYGTFTLSAAFLRALKSKYGD